MQNKMNINDWHSIQTLWDKLNKQVEKTKKVTGMLGTPRPYIKIIVELDDFLAKTLAGKLMKRKGWMVSKNTSVQRNAKYLTCVS